MEYCLENGLFHLAFKKGELFVMRVMQFDGSLLTEFGGSLITNTGAVGIEHLKCFVRKRNISDDIPLMDAIKIHSKYVYQHPSTKEVELVQFIDGRILLKELQIYIETLKGDRQK